MGTGDPVELLAEHARRLGQSDLVELLNREPERVHSLCLRVGALQFDFSRNHLDQPLLQALPALLAAANFSRLRQQLFAGGVVNPSENRPALHTALRAAVPPRQTPTGEPIAEPFRHLHEAAADFAEAIRNGRLRSPAGPPWQHVLHLGIGGSAQGPQLLLQALAAEASPPAGCPQLHIATGADGHQLRQLLDRCDPATTLVIAASKSFASTETLQGLRSVLAWLNSAGITATEKHLVAISSAPEKADAFAVPPQQRFRLPESIGGRYSVWSAMSLVAMIGLGRSVFDRFLRGGEWMDRHFIQSHAAVNAPILAGLLDVLYGLQRAETQAVFPYDSRLAELVPYLQQLAMESNGKSLRCDGNAVTGHTAPILWGGTGTEIQHSVMQLLHQGTHLVPANFICVQPTAEPFPEHQRLLLINCLAQATALMRGTDPGTEPERSCPGNRPSTIISLQQLSPEALGMLLAFWEHRCFTAAALWQINPFDQMGVELGKTLARQYQELPTGQTELCPLAATRLRQWLGNSAG